VNRSDRHVIRWFLTHDAYDAWRDTLPVEDQVTSDLHAHVGHTVFQFIPNQCTACALTQKMMETLP
jgi:hypothetical protein